MPHKRVDGVLARVDLRSADVVVGSPGSSISSSIVSKCSNFFTFLRFSFNIGFSSSNLINFAVSSISHLIFLGTSGHDSLVDDRFLNSLVDPRAALLVEGGCKSILVPGSNSNLISGLLRHFRR